MIQKFRPALVLLALLPGPALGQAGAPPPPPGPYRALPEAARTVPASAPLPPPAARAGQEAQATAAQLWGPSPALQLPYWMQVPGSGQIVDRPGGTAPVVGPDARGGGQADRVRLSPAGQTAAPTPFPPGYGAGPVPGGFPGYVALPDPGAATGGSSLAPASVGQGGARNAGQAGGYGWPGYPAWPAYPGFPLRAGQAPVPYWGAPVPHGYGTDILPGQASR